MASEQIKRALSHAVYVICINRGGKYDWKRDVFSGRRCRVIEQVLWEVKIKFYKKSEISLDDSEAWKSVFRFSDALRENESTIFVLFFRGWTCLNPHNLHIRRRIPHLHSHSLPSVCL